MTLAAPLSAQLADTPNRWIDLRSDTVTLPTEAMLHRMTQAELGDDGLDGDPTVRRLERAVADLLGHEAGLYTPTATMANLLAVLSQAPRGSRVVLESGSHMLLSEGGGALLAGVDYQGVVGLGGAISSEALQAALTLPGASPCRLVCLENSHLNSGGQVLSAQVLQAAQRGAHRHEARLHLDGARLMNAAVALQLPVAELARHADTVSLCLSKGLSAPAGAVLVGSAETLAVARRHRKVLGGTQRQIGLLAATGLEAIHSQAARLAHDHAMAGRLARALRQQLPPALGVTEPVTNIVFIDLPLAGPQSQAWAEAALKHGVRVRPWGPRRLRLVTHRHIDEAAVDRAVEALHCLAGTLIG
jgi:threonine aldolase